MSEPMDDQFLFATLCTRQASSGMARWLAERPHLDRQLMALTVPHDMSWHAAEWVTLAGAAKQAGIDGLRAEWGASLAAREEALAMLLRDAPLEHVTSRRAWSADGAARGG